MKIIPTNEKPWKWQCIEWESLKVYPTFVQLWDEYKGCTVEIHVATDGTLYVLDDTGYAEENQ